MGVIRIEAARNVLAIAGALSALCTSSCGVLERTATSTELHVAHPPDAVAAICAASARLAFPAADDRPYAAGALAVAGPGGRYATLLAEGADRQLRAAGNVRLSLRASPGSPLDEILAPVARRERTDATGLPIWAQGTIEVGITPAGDGSKVDITQRGSLRQAPFAEHLVATLRLASAVGACRDAMRAGSAELALGRAKQAIALAQTSHLRPDSNWLARAHVAAAAAQHALAAHADAARSLQAALDLAPDLVSARGTLAQLARSLAEPLTAQQHDRVLATMPGIDFTAIASRDRAAAAASVSPISASAEAWLAQAHSHLDEADLAAARRCAQASRACGADEGAALAVLATVAERRGDHRLATEFRMCQAQVTALTPDIALALSQGLAQQGDPQRAALWLGQSWHALGERPGARRLFLELERTLGRPQVLRVLAATAPAPPRAGAEATVFAALEQPVTPLPPPQRPASSVLPDSTLPPAAAPGR